MLSQVVAGPLSVLEPPLMQVADATLAGPEPGVVAPVVFRFVPAHTAPPGSGGTELRLELLPYMSLYARCSYGFSSIFIASGVLFVKVFALL